MVTATRQRRGICGSCGREMPGMATIKDGQPAVELRPHHTRPSGGEPCPGRGSVVLQASVELAACMTAGEHGDPGAARRVAELLELAGDDMQAASWWRRAAGLGDPDARDYVTGILDAPPPARRARSPMSGDLTGRLRRDGEQFRAEAAQLDEEGFIRRTLDIIGAVADPPGR